MAWNLDHLKAAAFHLESSEGHAREALQVVDMALQDPDQGGESAATSALVYTLQGIHHALLAQVHLAMPALPQSMELDTPDEHP